MIISEDAECGEAAQTLPQFLLPKGKNFTAACRKFPIRENISYCSAVFFLKTDLYLKLQSAQLSILHQLREQRPSQASQSSAETLPSFVGAFAAADAALLDVCLAFFASLVALPVSSH